MLLVTLLAGATGMLFYHGAFTKVEIAEERHGPYRLVFRPQIYVTRQSEARITEEIDTMLSGIGVEKRQPMAVYFSDGSAQVGVSVEDVQLNLTLSNGTTTRTIPGEDYMVARFPWKSPLSPMVGYYKVDPVLNRYRETLGYVQTEDMTLYQGDHILYLTRIARQP